MVATHRVLPDRKWGNITDRNTFFFFRIIPPGEYVSPISGDSETLEGFVSR